MSITDIGQIAHSAIETARAIVNGKGNLLDKPKANKLLDALEGDLTEIEAGQALARAAEFDVDGENVTLDELVECYRAFLHQEVDMGSDEVLGNAILNEPYPNEHAVRLHDPDKYIRIRRVNDKFGKGIHAIFGYTAKKGPRGGQGELQAIRFDAGKFTVAQAKKWLKDHNYPVSGFEPATGKTKEAAEVGELDGPMDAASPIGYPAYGPTSFADLDAEEAARDAAAEATKRTYQFHRLIDNVMIDPDVDDKGVALRALVEEFVTRIAADVERAGTEEATEALVEDFGGFDAIVTGAEADAVITALAGQEAQLAELEVSGPRAPVVVDLRIIRPGPGNERDKHYYLPETLRRDAHVFERADVFVTEHEDARRGEATKVGRIQNIVRIEPDGAPIGRTVIYDPDMAEKTRNRAAAGMLDTLACSIRGGGLVKPGKVDGKPYKLVTGLLEGPIVEFVSKAGAGGQAVALVENETGGEIMPDETKQTGTQPTEVQPPAPEQVAPQETPPEAPPEQVAVQQEESAVLAEAEVQAALGETHLPRAFKAALARGQYADKAALDAAIAEAVAEVKALTGSGAVFGQGETCPTETTLSEAEYNARMDAIIEKHTGKKIT